MQAALNKTCKSLLGSIWKRLLKRLSFSTLDKADKKAEKERLQKVEQERMNREEEMRELALRLRRK